MGIFFSDRRKMILTGDWDVSGGWDDMLQLQWNGWDIPTLHCIQGS